jgi:hypothetical protein
MGSRLYSQAEVERLLSGAGLRLERADHDFRFPFGFYREMPGGVAEGAWRLDTAVGRTPLGPPLASVSYWDARVV